MRTVFITVIGSFILASAVLSQEIKTVVGGNSYSSLWVVVDGEIEPGAAKRLQKYLTKNFSHQGVMSVPEIVLNGPGGSLLEGLRLGLLLRKIGASVSIGEETKFFRPHPDPNTEMGWVSSGNAICASACAYAFLGGVDRYMVNDGQIGFHQFFRKTSISDLENRLDGINAGSEAQYISGMITEYIYELGDISFLVLAEASKASPEEMNWLSRKRAAELGIITTELFKTFFLEPYGNGVVAASRASVSKTGYDTTRPYYRVAQATAYCRDGQKFLMLSSDASSSLDILDRSVKWGITGPNGKEVRLETDRKQVSVRTFEGKTYVDIAINNIANILVSSLEFWVSVPVPNSQGGDFRFQRSITEKERKILEVSFRLCI